jgi:hypothetical protein
MKKVLILFVTIIAIVTLAYIFLHKTAFKTKYNDSSWKTIIPLSCSHFYDGCNTCTRNPDGGAMCTLLGCYEYQKPKCLD